MVGALYPFFTPVVGVDRRRTAPGALTGLAGRRSARLQPLQALPAYVPQARASNGGCDDSASWVRSTDRSQQARRLEVRGRVIGAWHGVEKRHRAHEVGPQEVEAALAEQRRREARPKQETVRGYPPSALKGGPSSADEVVPGWRLRSVMRPRTKPLRAAARESTVEPTGQAPRR